MFSNNPLYYHPIVPRKMSGRRFEQILRCFSVEYYDQERINISSNPLQKLIRFLKLL